MQTDKMQSKPKEPADKSTEKREITLQEILSAANLLPSNVTDQERVATALRALDW